jgi:hypothetical protein
VESGKLSLFQDVLLELSRTLRGDDRSRTIRLLSDLDETITTIISRLETLLTQKKNEKAQIDVFAKGDTAFESMKLKPWEGWIENCQLSWLQSAEWLRDAPELRQQYQSSNDYAEVLYRLWVALTFYWGAGAVWPHCNCSTQNKKCNEPLLSRCKNNTNLKCTAIYYQNQVKTHCSNVAVWACVHSFRGATMHDAVCSICLVRRQNDALGSPVNGTHGNGNPSTDIYDATFKKEEFRKEEQIFYFTECSSRKPPFQPPNWQTTYRLQNSALVGIVQLTNAQQPVPRDSIIHWAEVVAYSSNHNDDHREASQRNARDKSNKLIALRILTKDDISALNNQELHFEPDSPVAIID